MQVDNKLLDDLARVAGSAMGALSGIRNEVDGQIRQQFERILSQMDMVSRDEFEAVKAMAATARARQEELEEQLAKAAPAGDLPAGDLADRVARLEAQVAALLARGPAESPANAAGPDGTGQG
ncbi:MAG: hypothetical protein RLY86_223 [Pseudomonadota bacterium]|jgi:BMFP domain-containing protein YqiC